MSFTDEIKKEAIAVQNKKTCCRKAFSLGLFLGSRSEEGQKSLISVFSSEDTAKCAEELLLKIFHVKAETFRKNVAGRISYCVRYFSPAVSDLLRAIDGGDGRPLHAMAGFRCENCVHAFLRGAFVACGSVTDPQKSYHAELVFPTLQRAEVIAELLLHRSGPVKQVKRGERFGIYYKSNDAIADMLYYIGCTKMGIYTSDAWIKRDIRNGENRATNCIAGNISKSVGAAQKQICAIERLIETGCIEKLSEELRYTARLRMEYDSATMSELAMLHIPPITKSGLNGRLRRIVEAAEELKE